MTATQHAVEDLYRTLLARWDAQDATGFGDLLTDDASLVGFDGTPVETRAAIVEHLRSIFADHATARYVPIVREVRELDADVCLLRAVVGMIPPGSDDIAAPANAVQSLVAVRTGAGWRVALLQSTPAAFHGRPDEVEALTAELRRAAGLAVHDTGTGS